MVRSRKRDKATCAFGVVMCGYGKVMDLTKTEMTVPKPNKGRKTAKKGGALLVRSFFYFVLLVRSIFAFGMVICFFVLLVWSTW